MGAVPAAPGLCLGKGRALPVAQHCLRGTCDQGEPGPTGTGARGELSHKTAEPSSLRLPFLPWAGLQGWQCPTAHSGRSGAVPRLAPACKYVKLRR